MGYACPVCETPQRDGEHLANHLAFTAMLRNDEHEAWLDEHVDDWGDRTPADLASVVTEHAAEREYDEVFEDTAGSTGGRPRGERGADATREHGGGHDHAHGHQHGHGDPARPDVSGGGAMGGAAEAVVDDAVESVLEEAQELTEAMYGLDEDAEDRSTGGDETASDTDDADEE
ncbi:DUF5810 domain-containing protein [Halobaculum marinum]|uniref:DUF5810 domain-containing protein n=1 Tax=Halobaculum marinum TaxID=3031996 RepID=A0ABD5WTU5_9EURY|nr:DUF5810 domain-containing protein [Halobaculum sp. DT55]